VANDPQLSTLLPAYAFARTIIAHPFPDGNGRLARALVHAALARTYDLNAPVLPLAPAFYMHAGKVALALRHLSDSGDWNRFAAVFRIVLEEARRLDQLSRNALTPASHSANV
jgi:Fic family protein